jgi:hypothetical protein
MKVVMVMKLIGAVLLVTVLAGTAAAEQSGLAGAIDRQRQDLATRQGEVRQQVDRQGGTLQQQQDRNLQFQLLQRQQPIPAPAPQQCTAVTGALVCP